MEAKRVVVERNRAAVAGVLRKMRFSAWVLAFTCACRVETGRDAEEKSETAAVTMPGAPATPAADRAPVPSVATPAPVWSARPRPERMRGDVAVRANAECEACHAAEARAWRSSHHRSAFVDRAFQRALSAEPSGFCRGCHAPEADPRVATAQAAHDIGVGCVSCHLDAAGAVLAVPRDGTDDTRAPHAIVRAPEMASEQACAGCHEFSFPGDPRQSDDAFMQTTVREHGRSPSSSRACAACHMPSVDGRRDHGFANVRDPAWLRDALTVEVARGEGDAITITLAQKLAGHAFPTGDLFRRLEVGAVYEGGGKTSRDADHLARHFVLEEGVFGRKLELDDRLAFEPAIVELHLAGLDAPAAGAQVRWWVKLQRVATPGRGKQPEHAIVESEVTLFEGTLRPEVKP